eukprot:761852-Hanusia_phi.AAC.1
MRIRNEDTGYGSTIQDVFFCFSSCFLWLRLPLGFVFFNLSLSVSDTQSLSPPLTLPSSAPVSLLFPSLRGPLWGCVSAKALQN